MPGFDSEVGFGRRAAERIVAAVKRVESTTYERSDTRPRWPVIAGIGVNIVDGVVTNTITPFNANAGTYGSGTVQAVWATLNANSGAYTSTNNNSIGNVTVYMTYKNNSTSISTNTRCKIVQQQTANGGLIWEYLGGDC